MMVDSLAIRRPRGRPSQNHLAFYHRDIAYSKLIVVGSTYNLAYVSLLRIVGTLIKRNE